MGKYYYAKNTRNKSKKVRRLISVLFLSVGVSVIVYILFPLISWQIYFQPIFASQDVTLSIPNSDIVSLAKSSIDLADYTKAENWFKNYNPNSNQNYIDTPYYVISLPKINIDKATVSTIDTDLEKHLVNYQGTSLPGKNGNAVIFGHSTLPQLFDPKNYKTIFANLYKLQTGDVIYAILHGVTYKYKIFKTVVVDPSDSSALAQSYDNSYLTLVTCTPPGTIWKRLIVKAKLEEI